MRRRRPGSPWNGLDARREPADAATGRRGTIVSSAPGDWLPPLERLTRLEPDGTLDEDDGASRRLGPRGAVIVDDLLDGRRMHPEPPRRIRPPSQRLAARLSPPVWAFVALAAVQALTIAAATRPSSVLSLADLMVRLTFAAVTALLPAAVLLWRREAWRSARLVLVGTIVWTTLPAAAAIVWSLVRAAHVAEPLLTPVAAATGLAGAVAFLGPALVALGIDRIRGRATLLPSVREIILFTFVLAANAGRWLPQIGSDYWPRPSVGDAFAAANLPDTIVAVALPIGLLCLLPLAWTCLSAYIDEESPRQFWRSAAAGIVVLAIVGLGQLVSGDVSGRALSGLPARSPETVYATALLAAGFGLLVLAFAAPVWSSSREATSWRAAPDDVFIWGDAGTAGTEAVSLGPIVAVAAGTDHALALDDGGRLAAWGNDEANQIDVPAELSPVVAIAAGDAFSLALKADGHVVAWGRNDAGQTDVPRDLAGVSAVAAGLTFSLALTREGQVVGWGDDSFGQLAIPDGLAGAVAIAAGDRHALALLENGAVLGWGDDTDGQARVPKRLSRVTTISAGANFSLALQEDGTIAGWGDNSYGQLDVPARLKRAIAISAGAYHAVALLEDGDVVGWGGGGERSGEAVRPWRLVDFKAVAAGDGFSLAVRAT